MGFETLGDGSSVLLRVPTPADLERYLAFFRALPEADRRYLRFDVTNEDIVRRLLQAVADGKAHRMAALVDDQIVAHAALEYDPTAWQRHLGEIRTVVASGYRRRGLGRLMISAMVHSAKQRGLAVVIVKIPALQVEVRKLFEGLGFHFDALLEGHIVDSNGQMQDMVVMRCALDAVSQALRECCRDDNWPDG